MNRHAKSPTSRPPGRPIAAPPALPRLAEAAATIAVVALALVSAARLMEQAGRARLYTDECFHAYVAEWIASHHRLPDVLPELYSGFSYYYPPLFHLLGAAWVLLAGTASLAQLNVALFALLLASLAWLPVPGLAAAPRRWAALLCIANGWLALYAVRFYVEMLISTLVLLAALLLWRLARTLRTRDAVWLGVASGLALIAKHTALVLPAVLAGLAIVAALRRQRAALRCWLLTLGIALAIALPYFVRNQLRFGSPIYPAFARDTHELVWKLNLAKFGLPAAEFYRSSLSAIGPWVLAMTAAALVLAALRRRLTLPAGLAIGGLVVFALGAAAPLHDVRHVTPLIAVLAIAASARVWDAASRRAWVAWTIEAGLLLVAIVAVTRLGDLRRDVDLPPGLEQAYAAARQRAPADGTILSLWTYDTFYYTRIRATWPIPWAQREHPVELFYEKDPQRFDALLRRYGIDLMFVLRTRPPAEFDGANYPASFVDCVVALIDQGALVVLWKTDRLALVGRPGAER